MTVEKATATVDAGEVRISIRYVDQDGRRNAGTLQPQQGVSIQVLGDVDNAETQLLRFDCLDRGPHYHYDPSGRNERVSLDETAAGNPLRWTLQQLSTRLPDMVRRAGHAGIAERLETDGAQSRLGSALEEVESVARDTALEWRRTVTHNGSAELREIPGSEVVEAGNVRFGLEFRELPRIGVRGMAIHVLSDVAGQEIELLAFDCFDRNAHYHYGPRNKDLRHYWDSTVVPDPLRWTLDRLKEGKLGPMLERAGYPSVAAELDTHLVAAKLENEVEPKALAIREAHTRGD